MCARYTLTAKDKEILRAYPLKLEGYSPDANIAPTDFGFVITSDEQDIIQPMHFGIVPHWAKSSKLTYDTWNIRTEEVMEKTTYAPLLKNQKTCLIISDGFYEWEVLPDHTRQPWRFQVKNGIFAMAGLWSEWINPMTTESYRSFGIMTTHANAIVGRVHKKKRMPVILPKASENAWIDTSLSLGDRLSLCTTFPDEQMLAYKVSKLVNSVGTKQKPNKHINLTLPLNTDEPAAQTHLNF